MKPFDNLLSQVEPVLLGDEFGSELLGSKEGDLEVWVEREKVERESEEGPSVSDG